jgi:hypothetical protein
MRKHARTLCAIALLPMVACQLVGGIEEFRLTGLPEGGLDAGVPLDGAEDAAGGGRDAGADASEAGRPTDGGMASEAGDATGATDGSMVTVSGCGDAGGAGLWDCGPDGGESCCASPAVLGGTFLRSYDGVTNTDTGNPATVSSYRLDRFEVTVGRFRKFVTGVTGGWSPGAGSGKHAHLNGGKGLSHVTAGLYEPGWDSADVEAALSLLLADASPITADAVKALVAATTTRIEVPDLAPPRVDPGAYDALLAEVGT